MEVTAHNRGELAGLTAKAAGSAGKAGALSEGSSALQVKAQWMSALLAALGFTSEDAGSGGTKAPELVVLEGENGRQLRIKLPGAGQQALDLKAVARELPGSQTDAGGEAEEAATPLTEEQARAWLLAAGIPLPVPEGEASSASSESDSPGATAGDGDWKIRRRGHYSQVYRLLRSDPGQKSGSGHHLTRTRTTVNRAGPNPGNLNPVQPPHLEARGAFPGISAADAPQRASSGAQVTARGKEASTVWSGPKLAGKPALAGVSPAGYHSDGQTTRPIMERVPEQMPDQLPPGQRVASGQMEESLARQAARINLRGSAPPAGEKELISLLEAGPAGNGLETQTGLKMAAMAARSEQTGKKTGTLKQLGPSGSAPVDGGGQQSREDPILLAGPQAGETGARKDGAPGVRDRASQPASNAVIQPQEAARADAAGRAGSIRPRPNKSRSSSSGLKDSLSKGEALARPDNPSESQPVQPVSRFDRTPSRRAGKFEQLLRPAKEPGIAREVAESTSAVRLPAAGNGRPMEQAFDRPAGERLEKSKTGIASAAATARGRQAGDGGQVVRAAEPVGEGAGPTGQQDSGQLPVISSPRLEQIRHDGLERQLPVERLTGEVARMVKDLVAEMQFSSREDYSEMRISLKPEYLGKLQIKVAVEQGAVSAHFLAESSRVKALIESGFSQLQQELADSGFSLSQFSASVGQEDQAGFSDQPGWPQGQMNHGLMQRSGQRDAEVPVVAEPVQSGWHPLGTIDVLV